MISVADHKGLVADDGTQKPQMVKDLSYGEEVAVSFECDQKTSNKFLITQIAIVLRR